MKLESKKETFAQSFWIIISRFIIEFISIFLSCLVFMLFIWFQRDNQLLTDFLGAFILIWAYVGLLVMILLTIIDSIRNIQKKSLLFSALRILPFFVQTILSIFVELLLVVGIIWVVKSLFSFSNQEITGILVLFSLSIFEGIRRAQNVLNKFYTSIVSAILFFKKVDSWLKSSWLGIIYSIVTVYFLAIFILLLFLGLNSPFDKIPASAPELFSNTLTIVTAILAIFFAGATLIIQLLVGAYSYKFVTAIVHNRIFVSNFTLLVFIGGINLALLRFGWNQDLASFSFYSSIYAILSLVILVLGFIEYYRYI